MKRFCICSLRSHLNVMTFFPSDWGMLRKSRCVLIFFKRAKRRMRAQEQCSVRSVVLDADDLG